MLGKTYAKALVFLNKFWLVGKTYETITIHWEGLCLFVWGFSSHSRIFLLFGNVTIAGEELQIFTFARHLWRLSSAKRFAVEPSLHVTVLTTEVFRGWDSNSQPSASGAKNQTNCATAATTEMVFSYRFT